MNLDFGPRQRGERRRPAMPPPGSAPGTIMADPDAPPPAMRLIAYGPDGLTEKTLASPDELVPFLEAAEKEGKGDPASRRPDGRSGVVWLDVDGVKHAPTMARLGEILNLHRLTLADIVNTRQRAKIEQFDGYIFTVLRVPRRQGCIDTEQISMCLGPHFVVTFQEEDRPGDSFEPVRERIRHSTARFRSFGADYLAYALLDAVIDGYFPLLEELGDQLDTLEDAVLEGYDRATSGSVHLVRRDLITLRRAVWPLREAIGSLIRDPSPLVCDETRVYLRDCYDHTVQIIDLAESYRDVGAGLMEVYLSTVSNRLNEVMKVLTVIATIFIPLTFIVGIYGMNFDPEYSPYNMPEIRARYGYPVVMLFMLIVGLGMFFAFWRAGWIGKGPKSRRRPDSTPPSDPPAP